MKLIDARIKEPNQNLKRPTATPHSGRVSTINEHSRNEISYIDSNKLIPFHNQARAFFDEEEISKLAKTIKEHGIRQPLTVFPSAIKEGYFEVVSGERRYKAAKTIKLKKVPCIIIYDHKQAGLLAVIENCQRSDLHPIELGKSFLNLLTSQTCSTQDEVAEKVGVGRTKVTEHISFARNIKQEHANWIMAKGITDRKTLRVISETKITSTEQLEKILASVSYKTKRTKRRSLSLLSISLKEGELIANKKGIHICPKEMKKTLKNMLEEIVKDLS